MVERSSHSICMDTSLKLKDFRYDIYVCGSSENILIYSRKAMDCSRVIGNAARWNSGFQNILLDRFAIWLV